MVSNISKVNEKGMISIPKEILKQFNLEAGSEVSIMATDGENHIIPLVDFDELRNILPPI